MTQQQSSTNVRIVGNNFPLDPNKLRSVRLNFEYTNQDEVPADLDEKPMGTVDRKSIRYQNKPKGTLLWGDKRYDRGAIRMVSVGSLIRGLAITGLKPVKAYVEERPGEPGVKSKFRVSQVFMFPEKYEHRPEIVAILPKMEELRQRSARQMRSLRTAMVWGYTYVYLNHVYDEVGGELVDSGELQVDITCLYRTPLTWTDGRRNIVGGRPVSALHKLTVSRGELSLLSVRGMDEGETEEAVDEAMWFVDAAAFVV